MNYSGSSDRNKAIESKEINVDEEMNKIGDNDIEDDYEVNRIMDLFEKTRKDDIELFHEIMQIIKEIMEIISLKMCNKDHIKSLENLFTEVEEFNDEFLFWAVHKGIKIALDNKNIDIVHFLVVKKGLRFYNKNIHKNILSDYFKSLSEIDFIECNYIDMDKYVQILEMLINYGEANINEQQTGILNTPLHLATLFKQYQFLIILLKNPKCEVNLFNTYNETALDMAIDIYKSGKDAVIYEEIIKLLIRYGCKTNTQEI